MAKSLFKKSWEILCQKGPREFIRKSLGFIYRPLQPIFLKFEPCLYSCAAWKISKEVIKNPTATSLTNFLFDKFGHLIKPKQVRWEITELAKIIENLKPKIVLEIGTARGGTLFLFSRLATADATIISIDLPWENFGGYPNWKRKLYQKFASPEQKLILLRADSHQPETLGKLKTVLAGREIDFLFIDGDHSYAGVKRDYELYSPLVRKGGIIALHDVAKHKTTPECEVDRFWAEIKVGKKFKELIADPDQDWGGIGVIFE